MNITNISPNIRPFIKWPGNKYRLLNIILNKLPKGKILIEPFLGSGAVFLNTNYEYYILSDANKDLINLYKILQNYGKEFIEFCNKFFTNSNNNVLQYYKLREQFNNTSFEQEPFTKTALFLYLNRHGYNGLCRYNKNNKFNVPFGNHKNPRLPHEAMQIFAIKAKRAKFLYRDFLDTFSTVQRSYKNHRLDNVVIYCDPPYAPISATANFTAYQPGGFTQDKQEILAKTAIKLSQIGIPVLVSNHLTVFTRKIYQKATEIITFPVRRMISCDITNRNCVTEMLALFK